MWRKKKTSELHTQTTVYIYSYTEGDKHNTYA